MTELNDIAPPPGVPGKELAERDEEEQELEPLPEITEAMVKKLETKSNKFMLQACTLDGAGHSRAEIAHHLGISSSTVARFRRDPDYAAMKKALQQRSATQLEPIVHSLKINLATAGQEAIKTLQEAMSADTLDGSPKWPVRTDAAKALLDHVRSVMGTASGGSGGGDNSEGGGSEGSKAPTAMVINVNPQVVQQARETAQHVDNEEPVDAEVVENG